MGTPVQGDNISGTRELTRLMDPSVSPLRYQITTHAGSAFSSFDGALLGPVDVVRYETLGRCRLSRTQQHLRADHIDDLLFCVTLQ
ncbi:MAG TPA: hypothetical protein VJM31_06875, partial [Vicinamibacterales bacterium]|nr:hypothetical protein [Vicinamibacterales bacterium]